jgi:hypothetical protein
VRLVDAERVFESYVEAGLASIGVDADEIELAVIKAAWHAYQPQTDELWAADLSAVEPELDMDLSRAPSK